MIVSNPRTAVAQKDGTPTRAMFVWLSQVSDLLSALTQSGVTADRPVKLLYVGRPYFDTTLGHPIWYDGANWIDSGGNTV